MFAVRLTACCLSGSAKKIDETLFFAYSNFVFSVCVWWAKNDCARKIANVNGGVA